MSKRALPVRIDETPPVGEITDAETPIPVQVRVVWGFLGPSIIDNAWAIAWTKGEVLVLWRSMAGEPDKPTAVWVRADQVKRR